MNITDIVDKVTHSKCPSCKKYGIGAMRGISRRHTHVETCRYCGKRYRVNSALSFILKAAIPILLAAPILVLSNLFNFRITDFEATLAGVLGLSAYLIVIRFCPMEEEPEEEKEPGFILYNIDGAEATVSCIDKVLAYRKNGEVCSVAFGEIKYKELDAQLLGICKQLLSDGRLSAFEYIIEYILMYDRDFAMQYIMRYEAGNFTQDELLKSKKTETEYIIKYAAQLADHNKK